MAAEFVSDTLAGEQLVEPAAPAVVGKHAQHCVRPTLEDSCCSCVNVVVMK